MNKLKEKINKVKELAERGCDGEKENAINKLKELQNKLNLTKKEKKKLRSFKLADYNDCKDIMVHCILDVDINTSIEGSKQKKELYCNLTNSEYNDVCYKFNHYYPIYNQLKVDLLKNFIIENKLGIE